METLLTTTYTAAFRRIVVQHLENGNAVVSSCGEVTEAEELAAVKAEGRDVPGWSCSLS